MVGGESVRLQSVMEKHSMVVKMKLAVAKIVKVRTARERSARLVVRKMMIRQDLAPRDYRVPDVPLVASPSVRVSRDLSIRNRKKVWSRPDGSSDESGDSDEERLARKVRVVPVQVVSEVRPGRAALLEESEEEEPVTGSSPGSECGEAPVYEEEVELTSEEESDECEEGSGDDVIYMGRSRSLSTIALRQSLLSQYFERSL